MQSSFLLGVSVGESFAEYSLMSDSKPVAQKRVYLSRENLKQSLSQFMTEHADKKPQHAFISLRLPKKLLDYNLSGAVAHITTEGFEHWLDVCGDANHKLTSKDLLFSVRERILADGKVEIALQEEELEAIAAKLQLIECKKVCLHFLHSSRNPIHQDQARLFLQKKGLDVFTPEKTDTPNEVARWNKNALNATIAGVHADRKEEILKALEGSLDAGHIYFLDSVGKILSDENSAQVDSLFSAATALGLNVGAPAKASVLYLGLENFLLISSSTWSSSWNSAWGPLAVNHLQTKMLGIQPTLGIHLNEFGRFDFTTHQEGWEPGPMFLGRGQKLSLLDLWSENSKLTKLQGLEDRFSAQGIQRAKNSLFAISKISRTRDNDLNHITKEMQSLSMQRLAMEAFMLRETEKMIVTGPLASVFANAFKKDPHTVIETQEFSESQAIALRGYQALQETL